MGGHDDVAVRNSLGLIFTKLEQFDNAEREYMNALNLDPDDLTIFLNLSELYIISGDYSKSYEFAEEGYKSSDLKDKIVSKLLMIIGKILLKKNQDKTEFIEFLSENEGYELSFEFETLKEALKGSEHYNEIEELIEKVKKYSKK